MGLVPGLWVPDPAMITWVLLVTWSIATVDAIIKDDSNGCSKIFTGAGGEITSPGYPEQYPDNAVCAWVIKAQDNYRIRLTFVDFQIEGEILVLYFIGEKN